MTSSCGSGAPWQEGTTGAVFDAFLGCKMGPAVSRGPALVRPFTKAVSPETIQELEQVMCSILSAV